MTSWATIRTRVGLVPALVTSLAAVASMGGLVFLFSALSLSDDATVLVVAVQPIAVATIATLVGLVRRRAFPRSAIGNRWLLVTIPLTAVPMLCVAMAVVAADVAAKPGARVSSGYWAPLVDALGGAAAGWGLSVPGILLAALILHLEGARRRRKVGFATPSPLDEVFKRIGERDSYEQMRATRRRIVVVATWALAGTLTLTAALFAWQWSVHAGLVRQKRLDRRLHQAVWAGDEALIRHLVAEGARPDSTSLLLAPDLSVETLRLLIDHGVPVTGPEAEQTLLRAVNHNLLETVRLLLDAGASPSDPYLLSVAIARGQVEEARLLLEHGAHPDGTVHAAHLHHAARTGSEAMVKLLLEHGADPLFRDSDGRTAAEVARRRGHGNMARAIETAARK